jgi:hypothetical protein
MLTYTKCTQSGEQSFQLVRAETKEIILPGSATEAALSFSEILTIGSSEPKPFVEASGTALSFSEILTIESSEPKPSVEASGTALSFSKIFTVGSFGSLPSFTAKESVPIEPKMSSVAVNGVVDTMPESEHDPDTGTAHEQGFKIPSLVPIEGSRDNKMETLYTQAALEQDLTPNAEDGRDTDLHRPTNHELPHVDSVEGILTSLATNDNVEQGSAMSANSSSPNDVNQSTKSHISIAANTESAADIAEDEKLEHPLDIHIGPVNREDYKHTASVRATFAKQPDRLHSNLVGTMTVHQPLGDADDASTVHENVECLTTNPSAATILGQGWHSTKNDDVEIAAAAHSKKADDSLETSCKKTPRSHRDSPPEAEGGLVAGEIEAASALMSLGSSSEKPIVIDDCFGEFQENEPVDSDDPQHWPTTSTRLRKRTKGADGIIKWADPKFKEQHLTKLESQFYRIQVEWTKARNMPELEEMLIIIRFNLTVRGVARASVANGMVSFKDIVDLHKKYLGVSRAALRELTAKEDIQIVRNLRKLLRQACDSAYMIDFIRSHDMKDDENDADYRPVADRPGKRRRVQ